MADPAASVGIVAIGRNEGNRLVRCLASIPAGVPAVYVDSASTDGSPEAAEAAGAVVLALDLARPFTAARARAEGVDLLFGRFPAIEFVMFVDGDCEIEAGWLTVATDFLQAHPDFATVCGRRRERHPEASFYNKLADDEWAQPPGEASECGGDSVMRATAYRAVGGFDPKIIAGEEPELCSRLRGANWRIMRLATPMTIHDAATYRFGQWWKRVVRSGFGYAQAWQATRANGRAALYRRELIRAVGWTLVLPVVSIVLAVLVHPAAILLWPALNILQIVRRRAVGVRNATLGAIAHYAVSVGILRYVWRVMRGNTGGTIVYK